VLLLFLFALALSIVLKPRSHDMPQELSQLLRAHPASPAGGAASGAEPGCLDGYDA
jgi:hypothetical protein